MGAAGDDVRRLLDSAPCGLVLTTESGTLLQANLTFCQWLGFTVGELVGHRRLQDLLTMGGRIFHQTHWSPLMRMQGSVAEVKLELKHRDGSLIPMVLNAVRDEESGETVHRIAAFVARDRDKYERELLLSRKKLEELVGQSNQLRADANDRALAAEQMIGIVSHDLRNPLSGIAMATTLLERSDLTPSQHRNVTRISRASERARWLIGDLLDFTQARLGRGLSISVGELPLHQVVAESVEELGAIYPGRKLQHHPRGEGLCRADRNRISQLLGNLVSNAIAYGRPDAPITVTSAVEKTGAFHLEVHNEGPTISESTRERLFLPMTRGGDAASADRSVGLGLYIVREIAKAHGGTVAVESSPGEGTTFRAMFPASSLG